MSLGVGLFVGFAGTFTAGFGVILAPDLVGGVGLTGLGLGAGFDLGLGVGLGGTGLGCLEGAFGVGLVLGLGLAGGVVGLVGEVPTLGPCTVSRFAVAVRELWEILW